MMSQLYTICSYIQSFLLLLSKIDKTLLHVYFDWNWFQGPKIQKLISFPPGLGEIF